MRRKLAILFALALSVAGASAENSPQVIQRIAFGSCNREYKPQPLWKPIRECKPDLWIWLGDIVYGKAADLKDLERRYQTEKNHDGYKSLRQESRILGVWDDNDYGVSDGGKENPNKIQSEKLMLDFLDEPPDSPRRQQAGVYASYSFGPPGQRVKIILLDGRYNRDKPGPNADTLGAEQWRWLESQLSATDATITLIGSGIQVIPNQHPYEKWGDFPQARERLLNLIAKSGAPNVILISGDRHLGEISRMNDPRFPQGLYDITSSGLTHHAFNSIFYNFNKERNQFRRGNNYVDLNFGLIEFNWDATPPTATLQVRDVNNAVRAEEKITLRTSDGANPNR